MAVDRPRMTREERAKQFLPFSAVRGLEEALEKKRAALFHSEKPMLAPDMESEIDKVLRTLKKGDRIKVVYYIGDEDKSCVSQDIFVNAWQPLPEPYQPKGE